MRAGLYILGLCFLLCGAAAAHGEESERPRIGLVLSGGGARGAAHVGVLRVLEELRVPVHCIAGTSAGALVGGMYAVGMSPDEIEALLEDLDWNDLLDDRPRRRELPYRRKQDDLKYLSRFELGFNHGSFQLPPGLVIGQELSLLLGRVTLSAAGSDDFDTLPIPFRAVATDIRTGELVVLRRGDLSLAMRASMSLPGIFAPVKVDDRLLADGGMVMNLPVEVAREMTPDVIIAVDLGNMPIDEQRLGSVFGVVSQVVTAMIRSNVTEQSRLADVLITPDIAAIKMMEFERTSEAIDIGEAAARSMADILRPLAIPAAEHAAYLHRVRGNRQIDGTISAVQVGMSSTADPELVMDRVSIRPGDALDADAIGRDVQRLYELGDYERVSYRLLEDREGYALLIDVDDRSWGPNTIRFGISLVSDFEGSSSFNLLGSYTMTSLNRRRAEAKLELQLGNDPTLRGELYQPLDRSGRCFVAVHGEISNHVYQLFDEPDSFTEYRVQQVFAGVDLGVQFGKYGELRAGVVRGSSELTPRHEEQGRAPVRIHDAGYRLALVIDQVDDANLPRHGYWGSAELFLAREILGGEARYERLQAGFGRSGSRGRHTGLAWFNAHSALASNLPFYARYQLGGLFNLSGYRTGALTGRYGGMVGLAYMYQLYHGTNVVRRVMVGGSVEAGNVWESSAAASARDLLYAASSFVGVDTMLGPIFLGYGQADSGEDAWYLYMGRFF